MDQRSQSETRNTETAVRKHGQCSSTYRHRKGLQEWDCPGTKPPTSLHVYLGYLGYNIYKTQSAVQTCAEYFGKKMKRKLPPYRFPISAHSVLPQWRICFLRFIFNYMYKCVRTWVKGPLDVRGTGSFGNGVRGDLWTAWSGYWELNLGFLQE